MLAAFVDGIHMINCGIYDFLKLGGLLRMLSGPPSPFEKFSLNGDGLEVKEMSNWKIE